MIPPRPVRRLSFVLLVALLALFTRQRAVQMLPFDFYMALLFLLLWTTKWAQYILNLTAPLCLCAAEGLRALLGDPFATWRRQHLPGARADLTGSVEG